MVSQQVDGKGWCILYMSQPHSQPVLSLALAASQSFYLTSSADAIIAKHPIPTISHTETNDLPMPNSSPATQDLPSLPQGKSLLSSRLADAQLSKAKVNSTPLKIEIQTTPLKLVQTKHSGQQSLQIRSDSKIFATAGWDSRVRVYSVQTLKELAVLKWHKEGCFSVAFAEVSVEALDSRDRDQKEVDGKESEGSDLVPKLTSLSVKGKRISKATTAHWLAAGSKDGKVSLWEIY